MAYELGTPNIGVADGYWMHIRHTQVCHRRYPWVRGEGRSLREATSHLLNQLARAFEFAHGRDRDAFAKAIADVRAFRSSRLQALSRLRRQETPLVATQ